MYFQVTLCSEYGVRRIRQGGGGQMRRWRRPPRGYATALRCFCVGSGCTFHPVFAHWCQTPGPTSDRLRKASVYWNPPQIRRRFGADSSGKLLLSSCLHFYQIAHLAVPRDACLWSGRRFYVLPSVRGSSLLFWPVFASCHQLTRSQFILTGLSVFTLNI